jgi:hypothetical protein
MGNESIQVRRARVHNLKNINFEIPHNALTVVTGGSGSGKSSLAFDTIYAEGQRRYIESLSAYARQFLERIEKPDVDEVAERVLALAPGSRYYLLFPVRGTAAAGGPCPPFPPATWPTCPAGRRRSACARRPTCGASLSV